jgi:hypothetical protein
MCKTDVILPDPKLLLFWNPSLAVVGTLSLRKRPRRPWGYFLVALYSSFTNLFNLDVMDMPFQNVWSISSPAHTIPISALPHNFSWIWNNLPTGWLCPGTSLPLDGSEAQNGVTFMLTLDGMPCLNLRLRWKFSWFLEWCKEKSSTYLIEIQMCLSLIWKGTKRIKVRFGEHKSRRHLSMFSFFGICFDHRKLKAGCFGTH